MIGYWQQVRWWPYERTDIFAAWPRWYIRLWQRVVHGRKWVVIHE